MTRSFGDHAVHLYGVAARTLGWRAPDFWTATPAELLSALIPAASETGQIFDRDELKRLMDIDNA